MTMKKVFHFDSPREHYECDAAIVSCFDDRFQLAFAKFLKRRGIFRTDYIKIAGGAKILASAADSASGREFVLEQIRISMRLHATKRVVLMVHSDCGAYDGLAGGFGGDARAEAEHHEGQLRRAAENLQAAIKGVELQAYFVDFEGIWAVTLPAGQKVIAS